MYGVTLLFVLCNVRHIGHQSQENQICFTGPCIRKGPEKLVIRASQINHHSMKLSISHPIDPSTLPSLRTKHGPEREFSGT